MGVLWYRTVLLKHTCVEESFRFAVTLYNNYMARIGIVTYCRSDRLFLP
jgi:hypothetical protein